MLTARFRLIERGDEPLVAGPDTITLPAGTTIVTRGSASIALAGAAWISPAGTRSRLATTERRFDGRFTPGSSGTWNLSLTPAGQDSLEDAPPPLLLRLVADSAPTVAVPVPDATRRCPSRRGSRW
jgi:hypothetical protein